MAQESRIERTYPTRKPVTGYTKKGSGRDNGRTRRFAERPSGFTGHLSGRGVRPEVLACAAAATMAGEDASRQGQGRRTKAGNMGDRHANCNAYLHRCDGHRSSRPCAGPAGAGFGGTRCGPGHGHAGLLARGKGRHSGVGERRRRGLAAIPAALHGGCRAARGPLPARRRSRALQGRRRGDAGPADRTDSTASPFPYSRRAGGPRSSRSRIRCRRLASRNRCSTVRPWWRGTRPPGRRSRRSCRVARRRRRWPSGRHGRQPTPTSSPDLRPRRTRRSALFWRTAIAGAWKR